MVRIWQQSVDLRHARVQPREVLIPEPLEVSLDILHVVHHLLSPRPCSRGLHTISIQSEHTVPCQQFAVHTLDGFGCEGQPLAIAAAGALVAYVHETQHNTMTHLYGLRLYSTSDFMGAR